MDLKRKIRFPEADIYRGTAYYSEIKFTTLRIPWIAEEFAYWLAGEGEKKIRENGGVPLVIEVWQSTGWVTYDFWIKYWFYLPGVSAAVIPAVVWGIVQAIIVVVGILLGLWLLGQVVEKVGELIWGPEEIPSWVRMIIPIGITAALVAYAYSKFIKKR